MDSDSLFYYACFPSYLISRLTDFLDLFIVFLQSLVQDTTYTITSQKVSAEWRIFCLFNTL